ncbi:MAG: hypothetical protein ABSE21_17710 [Bryobacteraceae bacterium]|jgi:hypothetical protein
MRILIRVIPCLLAAALASVSGLAQNGTGSGGSIAARLSSVPLWPSNGIIPPEDEKHYVFLDPAKGEVVLSYPENLGNTDGAPLSSVRKTFRYQRWNRVRPGVQFSVAARGDGRFEYTYAVSNEARAMGPIRALMLVAPALDLMDLVEGPKYWLAYSARSDNSAVQMVLQRSLRNDGYVNWMKANSDEPGGLGIAPGQSMGGFHLICKELPGFSTMYIQGYGSTSMPEDLPEEVSNQFLPFMKIEGDSQQIYVFGPKFPSSTSKREIAADFHIGLQHFTVHRVLSAQSPFVSAALAALARYINAPGWFVDGAPVELSVPDELLHLPTPAQGLESNIALALKVALQTARTQDR